MAETVALTSIKKEKKKEKTFIVITKRLLKNKLAVAGLIIIALQIAMAIFAPFITFHDPVKQNLNLSELPMFSENHWLGTDNYGRDVWSRIVYGARISLIVGIVAVTLGLIGGVILGMLGGYYKKLDGLIMRIVDLLFSFPGILLAMLIIAILGTSLINVAIAISIWSIPTCARIVRGSVLSIKEKEYIMAMKSLGASDLRIMFKHILPNAFAPIIVFATMRMATAILSTASLSYLGLGAQPPTPEWGAMLNDATDYFQISPYVMFFPGLAIVLFVLSCQLVSERLGKHDITFSKEV